MLRICDQVENCPDDFVGNFSSEADDTLDFISRKFAPAPPKIKNLWKQIGCGTTFVSDISQADADQQAAAALALCTQTPCDGLCTSDPTFCNTLQAGCFTCPDGTRSCFVINAGVFCGYANQAAADSAAALAAQLIARQNPVCPGPIDKCTCVGSGYLGTITANVQVTWTLVDGSLPPGLVFGGGHGFSTSIFGIPLTAGTYTFQIKAQSSVGAFALKTYSIVVLQVVTPSLPPFTIGVPYGPVLLQAIGGSGNYNWRIVSGSLPPGLTLDINGIISGTPT